ncbi:ATP-binding protein [Nonomuraea polychroma]|uniref:ATP-binding protein n=1 Tax=Nonomuraea polychroma TaxID=46176 RepID=UPI003D9120C2
MGEGTQLRCPITEDLALLRTQLHDFASASSLASDRVADLMIAVNEAATNVLEHGAGSGTLIACHDESGVWVDVIDSRGALTADDLFTSAPSATAMRGYGLSIVRRLCDQVSVDHPNGHSRLRLRMSYQSDKPEE